MKKRCTLAFPYPLVNVPGATLAGMLALCACSGTNALADTLNTVQGCGGAAGPGTTIARDFVPIPTSEAIDGSGQFSLTAGCNASGSGQLAAVAYGSYAVVTGAAGVAVGVSTVAAKWAAAYGVDAAATGTGSIALGAGSVATALNSVSIGSGAGDGITFRSVADSTQATAAGAIAIGANATRGAQAFAADTIAIGGQATAGAAAANAVAIGRGANVTVANGMALGNGASATATNSVALGSGSTTAAPHTGVTSRFGASVAGTASAANGTVSLGATGAERQMQNVAAGVLSATSTDAVNGSQLFAVAAGVDSVGTSVAATLGGGAAYNPATGTMSGFSVPLTAVGTNGAVGVSTPATTVGSALGTLNTSVGNTANIAVKYGTSGSAPDYSSVVMAGAVSTDGGVTGGTRLSNLSRGTLSATSTDAVNGSQLFAANQQVSQNTTNIAGNTSSIASLGTRVDGIYTAGTKYFHATSSDIDSQASGLDSIAIGPSAAATEDGDIAIGVGAVTLGGNSIAIGPAAIAMNPNSVALGMGSFTSSANPVPSGTVAGKTVTYAGGAPTSVVSVGNASDQRQIINVAAGRVTASSTDAINGSQLFATNEAINTLAADASTAVAAAVKYDQTGGAADYTRMTLAGPASTDGGVTGGTRISNLSQGALSATSTDAVNGSQLFSTNQQVDQNTANIAGNTSSITALGTRVDGVFDNGTKYFHANSTGADSQPIGVDSVAIGPTAIANNAGDVALGAGAVTAAANPVSGATIGGTPFVFAGGAPASVVSLGSPGNERQITNVAAGRITSVSTDAINGSQLFATNEVLDTLVATTSATALGTVKYDQAGGAPDYTRMTLAGPASTDGGVTGGTRISNLSQGALSATSTDAVNGSQLFSTNQQVDQNTANIAGNTSSITALGTRVDGVFDNGTKYFHANSTGADSQPIGVDSVAIGPTAIANNAGDVALGAGAVTAAANSVSGATIGGTPFVFAGGAPASVVSLGSPGNERQITNVAAGRITSVSTDAINGSQLFATNEVLDTLVATTSATALGTVKYDQAGGAPDYTRMTLAGPASTDGGVTGGTRISNLSQGALSATSTDAVNGSQLFATNQKVDQNTANITDLGNQVSSYFSTGTKYFHTNSTGADSQAVGLDSIAIGPTAVAAGVGAIAIGGGSQASQSGDVALGVGATANRGAANYTGKYSGASNTAVGTVAVGSAGAERTVSHVADGQEATDAVNVRQLDGAVNQANQYTDARIAAIDTSVVAVDQKLTEFSNRVGTVEGNVQTLRNGTSGLLQVSQSSAVLPAPSATGNNAMAVGVGATASGDGSTAIGNGASASGTGSYAVGNGATASGNNSAAAGNNAAASAANSTAVGNSARASAANSVAIGTRSVADRADSVSIGSIGNERQLTNVAPGTSDTDAANIGQLRAVEGSISGQLSRLRNDIDSNDNRASAGVATAMAMATLPQAYLPGRSMMSMGGGAWRGESGMAIGLSTVSDSGRWVVKGAVSSSSRGDYGGAVGVGYQW